MEQAFGDTSDLSEELVNTLCNLLYFAEVAGTRNFGGLEDLRSIHPTKNKGALVEIYTNHMSHVSFAVAHAPELIAKLRSIRVEDSTAFEYFESFTLDLLKYRIVDAQNKSGLRRALERKTKTPNELPGLARRFSLSYRSDAA